MTRMIFIAGMEHSGTTLLDYLLSGREKVVGLGEVFTLLDRAHREAYFRKWGHFDDAHECSCGERLEACPIWRNVHVAFSADPAAAPIALYDIVHEAVVAHTGAEAVIVDSSKSQAGLDLALEFARRKSIDLRVVLAIKDVRAFVTSVKHARKLGPRGQFGAFSWWQSINEGFLARLRSEGVPARIVTYEDLCLRTQPTLSSLFAFCGLEGGEAEAVMGHNRAHIATGNKDMLNRNRDAITYDTRWFFEDRINLMYLLRRRGRQLNRQLPDSAALLGASPR